MLELASLLQSDWDLSFKFVAGVDLLSARPFRICGGRSIEQVKQDALPASKNAIGVRLSQLHSVPRLDVIAGGLSIAAALDTGAMPSMTLTQAVIDRLCEHNSAVACPELTSVVIVADGRSVSSDAYWLREVVVGRESFRNVLVYVGGKNTIGMPIIRHFDMTMDLATHRLWLDPLPSAKTATFAPGATGFSFVFDGEGRIKVLSPMRPDGPAEQAGIRPDDRIVEIDGQSISAFTYYTATERFSQAGSQLKLKWLRGEESFEATLELKHRVAYPPDWPEEAPLEDVEKLFDEFERDRK